MWQIYGEKETTYTENTKYLADGIHRYGSKVFIMISTMSGRSGIPEGPAPSVLPNVWDPREVQRKMTVEGIHQYVEWFAIGAKAAGIDGIEIHAVHKGYLLD